MADKTVFVDYGISGLAVLQHEDSDITIMLDRAVTQVTDDEVGTVVRKYLIVNLI